MTQKRQYGKAIEIDPSVGYTPRNVSSNSVSSETFSDLVKEGKVKAGDVITFKPARVLETLESEERGLCLVFGQATKDGQPVSNKQVMLVCSEFMLDDSKKLRMTFDVKVSEPDNQGRIWANKP